MASVPSETSEHLALASWLDRRGIFWEHVPNGGSRTQRSGTQMRALGARAGSPDFRVYDQKPRAPVGVAVEMKRLRGGKSSKEQNHFLVELEKRGWTVYVARGADDAIQWLVALGY